MGATFASLAGFEPVGVRLQSWSGGVILQAYKGDPDNPFSAGDSLLTNVEPLDLIQALVDLFSRHVATPHTATMLTLVQMVQHPDGIQLGPTRGPNPPLLAPVVYE